MTSNIYVYTGHATERGLADLLGTVRSVDDWREHFEDPRTEYLAGYGAFGRFDFFVFLRARSLAQAIREASKGSAAGRVGWSVWPTVTFEDLEAGQPASRSSGPGLNFWGEGGHTLVTLSRLTSTGNARLDGLAARHSLAVRRAERIGGNLIVSLGVAGPYSHVAVVETPDLHTAWKVVAAEISGGGIRYETYPAISVHEMLALLEEGRSEGWYRGPVDNGPEG